jgi:hypothetical protein
MVCTHVLGIGRFLRIGVRAEKVGVAFCIICLHCMEKLPISDEEDDLRKVESMANEKHRSDMLRDIKEKNRLVKKCTYCEALLYLQNVRPLIEVGRNTLSVK